MATPDHNTSARLIALSLSSALFLAACGGGSSDISPAPAPTPSPAPAPSPSPEHPHLDTDGRLAVLEEGSSQVHVVQIDDARVLQSFTADHAPSAIYASPDRRYAVLLQRNDNQVQFIDGGVWQENHGDHAHDHQQAPALLPLRLSGVRPTHYESHEGLAAVFFDGNAATSHNASIALFSDASIGATNASDAILATQPLAQPMHGTAEPRGDWLLTTWRDPNETSPTHVELYHRHGDHFHFEQRFDVACPGLHGSYSNADYSVFGCTDGVLVIHQQGEQFSASKIAHDVRISTIIGHEDQPNFVGIGNPGHLFEIDPAAGAITRIDWAEGRTRRAHALDAQGENLLVLDDLGTLHILETQQWSKRAQIEGAIATMPTAAPFPAFATSAADDKAYLSDPQGKQLLTVDLSDAKLEAPIALNFSPTGLVWLGMPAHDHDH